MTGVKALLLLCVYTHACARLYTCLIGKGLPANLLCLCGALFWLVTTYVKGSVFVLLWFCNPLVCNSLV